MTWPVVVAEGCYEENWTGIIVPEAFAHPAKMSRSLIRRIFDELDLPKGSLIVDPFGGIGTTAIEGAYRGHQVVCCELEPKFAQLAGENMAQHVMRWRDLGHPIPIILNGDSRKLREHLQQVETLIVDEPAPSVEFRREWWDDIIKKRGLENDGRDPIVILSRVHEADLAVDVVVSSPPYEEIATGAGGLNTKPPKHEGQQGGRSPSAASQDTDPRYGDTPGQLGKMPKGDFDAVVSSPPFTQGYAGGGGINKTGITTGAHAGDRVDQRSYQGTGAERSEGNLETMRFDDIDRNLALAMDRQIESGKPVDPHLHAAVAGESVTFWAAARDIVRECHAVLKPGGIAVWVVKAFVRNKQIVDFPNDWRRLCEHVGFETTLEMHASLVQEHSVPQLFGDDIVKRKERKSFFRRLAEKKGSPRIDSEVVWFMRKRA